MEKWKIEHNIRCYEIATLMMKYEFDTKRVDEILSRVYREPIENRNESGIIEERYNDGSHYTKDEHGQFTGSTGSGGGSSGGGSFGGLRKEPKLYSNGGSSGGRSSATETKEQKILREKIKNGELTKNIYKPKQELHYRGTQQYEDFTKKHSVEKSYFTVSMTELQGILNKKYATGRVHIDRAGKITEIFDCGKEIGYDTGMKRNTSFVKVHYSKSKTHLVPHTINPNAEKKE